MAERGAGKVDRKQAKKGKMSTRKMSLRSVTRSAVQQADSAGPSVFSVSFSVREGQANLGPAEANKNRLLALEEMISQEKRYSMVLKMLNEIREALLHDGTIVEYGKVDVMFFCLPELCKLHQAIVQWMEQAKRNCTVVPAGASRRQRQGAMPPGKDLAGIFIAAILEQPMLGQVYNAYTKNVPYAKMLMQSELLQNDEFKKLLEAKLLAQTEQGTLDIAGYLDKPVLRMAHLRNDIKELLAQTPRLHSDRILLERGAERAESVVQELDALWNSQRHFCTMTEPSGLRSWDSPPGNVLHCQTLLLEQLADGSEAGSSAASSKRRLVFLTKDWLVSAELKSTPDQPTLAGTNNPVTPIRESSWSLHDIDASIQEQNCHACRDLRDCDQTAGYLKIEPKPEAVAQPLHRASYALPDSASASKWRVMIRLAQLLRSPENAFTWWKDDNTQYFSTDDPLLVRRITLQNNRQDQIKCGCYYAPISTGPSTGQNMRKNNTVWIGTTFDGNSEFAIYNHDVETSTLTNGGSLTLKDKLIKCIVHVPEPIVTIHGTSHHVSTNTVWIATWDKVLIYSATPPFEPQDYICLSSSPESLLYAHNNVYVGLQSGSMLVYGRDLPKVEEVAGMALVRLLAIGRYIYVATGTNILVYEAGTLKRVKFFAIRTDGQLQNPLKLSLIAHTVHGLWIVLQTSIIVSHFDVQTGSHLQDIDVCNPLLRFLRRTGLEHYCSSSNLFQITALSATREMLLVGTNVGVTLRLPLPAYGNVPVIGDNWSVAYHSHWDQVELLLPLVTTQDTADLDAYGYGHLYESTYPSRDPSRDLEFVIPSHLRHAISIEFKPSSQVSHRETILPLTRTHLEFRNPRMEAPVRIKHSATMQFMTGGLGYVNHARRSETPAYAEIAHGPQLMLWETKHESS